MNNYLMELNRKKEEEIWKVNKSGFLFLIKFGEFSTRRKLYRNPARRENLGTGTIGRKLYRNPVRREETGTRNDGRKLYRNPVRREETGTGNDRKKVVPESGTSGRIQRTGSDRKKVVPESGTSGRIREQTAIRRKLYRNPVRQVGSENRQRSEESCAEIRYVR